ncbi:Uncharacterised protein [Escherichia coli]|nr:Uncharacterised protein [Escherichia coli]
MIPFHSAASGWPVVHFVLSPFLFYHARTTLSLWRPLSGFYLMAYAVLFSVAYIHLDTGAGALLLFGAVQFAMVIHGLFKGESLSAMRGLRFSSGSDGNCCPAVTRDEGTAALQCTYDDRFRISLGRLFRQGGGRARLPGLQRRLILFSQRRWLSLLRCCL